MLSIAALGTAADKIIYTTAADTAAETAITAFGRSLIDDANAAAGLATLGASASTHLHDTQTLLADGINSNGGAFSFTTSAAVTFSQEVVGKAGGVGDPGFAMTGATTNGWYLAANQWAYTTGGAQVATFGSNYFAVTAGGGGLRCPDGGYFGSASDPDAIAIAAGGNVTLTQKLGIGGAPSYALDVTSSSDDVFRAISTRNIADAAMVRFVHNRGTANVADNDELTVRLMGDSDTTAGAIHSEIIHVATDVTHATRTAGLAIYTMLNGSLNRNFFVAGDGGIHTPNMKTGTDQADAGAAAGELYADTNDDNTVKLGT